MSARLPIRFAVLLLVVTMSCAGAWGMPDVDAGKTRIHRADTAAVATGEAQPAASAGTTLVFLGLLLAGAILVRRLVQQRSRQRPGQKSQHAIRLLGRQQIDHELSVRLLQVGPRVLVVGSTAQGLATLADVTDPAEIAQLTGDDPVATLAPRNTALFGGETPITRMQDRASVPTSTPAADRGTSPLHVQTRAGG